MHLGRYNQTARPFNWKFTAADLVRLVGRISAHEHATHKPAELPQAAWRFLTNWTPTTQPLPSVAGRATNVPRPWSTISHPSAASSSLALRITSRLTPY